MNAYVPQQKAQSVEAQISGTETFFLALNFLALIAARQVYFSLSRPVVLFAILVVL